MTTPGRPVFGPLEAFCRPQAYWERNHRTRTIRPIQCVAPTRLRASDLLESDFGRVSQNTGRIAFSAQGTATALGKSARWQDGNDISNCERSDTHCSHRSPQAWSRENSNQTLWGVWLSQFLAVVYFKAEDVRWARSLLSDLLSLLVKPAAQSGNAFSDAIDTLLSFIDPFGATVSKAVAPCALVLITKIRQMSFLALQSVLRARQFLF